MAWRFSGDNLDFLVCLLIIKEILIEFIADLRWMIIEYFHKYLFEQFFWNNLRILIRFSSKDFTCLLSYFGHNLIPIFKIILLILHQDLMIYEYQHYYSFLYIFEAFKFELPIINKQIIFHYFN
jgi:hypothetical protein